MNWTLMPVFYDNIGLKINNLSIVEHWEKPIQIVLANSILQRKTDRILEIGYGLGYASKTISHFNPKHHIIIEAHPYIAKKAKKELRGTESIVVDKYWQDVIDTLEENSFHGIVFDAYPIDNLGFDGSKESTMNFVFSFLSQSIKLLDVGGRLSFLDFSCEVTLLRDFQNFISSKSLDCNVIKVPINAQKDCTYVSSNFGNVVVLTKRAKL